MARVEATTDFSQYTKLRAEAEKDPSKALEKTAHQFEALYTQMMLKSMRAATKFGDDGLGAQGDLYKDWFDQQLAVAVSAGKGIGLADMMIAQLRGSTFSPTKSVGLKADPHPTTEKPAAADAVSMTTGTVAAPRADWPPASRHDFLAAIMPHARRAAEMLGLSPHTLVAQAALETGWGKHLPRDASGNASFNLFGIKADRAWSGSTAQSATHEVVDGVAHKTHASFRSYDSLAHAFDDYVNFLKGNPRYADALRHGGDDGRFTASLQKAGYASDPNYAAKIHSIAMSPALSHALDAVRGHGRFTV
jgi:flagellar protein FlgJ